MIYNEYEKRCFTNTRGGATENQNSIELNIIVNYRTFLIAIYNSIQQSVDTCTVLKKQAVKSVDD